MTQNNGLIITLSRNFFTIMLSIMFLVVTVSGAMLLMVILSVVMLSFFMPIIFMLIVVMQSLNWGLCFVWLCWVLLSWLSVHWESLCSVLVMLGVIMPSVVKLGVVTPHSRIKWNRLPHPMLKNFVRFFKHFFRNKLDRLRHSQTPSP
jgi:hypothetical protein